MSEQKQVATVDKKAVEEVSIFEKSANALKITGPADMEQATELLGSIKKMQKHLKTQETDAKKPYADLVKGIIAAFKPVNHQLSAAEDIIKDKVIKFRRAEAIKAEEQKAKLEARVGEGKGKLKVQTAINKIADVDANKSAAHTNTGTSSMTVRMVKKLNIIDESQIPREFLVVDTAKVRASAFKIHDLIKEGVTVAQIPGVEVVEEESIGAR